MSVTLEPRAEPRGVGGRINLVALAKPYFGLIVLTTLLLTAFGIVSMLRMPSGIYPEVTFPRVAVVVKKPGLDLVSTELLVTRPLELAASFRPATGSTPGRTPTRYRPGSTRPAPSRTASRPTPSPSRRPGRVIPTRPTPPRTTSAVRRERGMRAVPERR